MLSLNFYIFAHFLTAVISLFISYVVFTKNRKSVTHITLSLFSFSIFIWSAAYGIWLLSDSETEALFWSRILNLGATFIPVFLFHWILSFLGISKKKRILIIFYYVVIFSFALFSFSDHYIRGVTQIRQFLYWPQINWLYALFLLTCWIPIFLYSFYLLVKELNIRRSTARQQILYILLGLIIGFLGGSTNYLLMFGFDLIPPIGSIFVVIFPLFCSYAIVRHHLMDIKLVIRKSSVYLLSILTIILFVVAVNYNIINEPVTGFSVFADLGILILAILIFPYIKNYFYRFANKYFLSSLYDSREVIGDISDKLRTTLEAQKIYEYIHNSLDNAFHFKSFAIL
ncbi:MAG: histidine kinase N-terminal 7TM domain-containing protein, partial [Patescibacteria group bacterium]